MRQTTRPTSGMTIHRRPGRYRQQSGNNTVSDAGAMLTICQVILCVIMLVTVFTLQFIDKERYDRTGELYRAVMSGEGEAMYVGAFGTPITKELLDSYTKELLPDTEDGAKPVQPPTAPIIEEQQEQSGGQGGQGGQTPYLPPNLYMGKVLLSAKPAYPAYGIITSPFGVRTHPITGKTDFHTGLDIAGKLGDNIYAVLPGTVAEVGRSDIYGNYIRLTHAAGLETVYNHCSEILAAPGAVVRRGERIALVGSTGVSTGAHLHLDLLVNGCYTDPLQVFT
ncbi:MAG: M23 family metallopeptidase [Angelakisella sp.]